MSQDLAETKRFIRAAFGAPRLSRTKEINQLGTLEMRDLIERHEARARSMANIMAFLVNPGASPFASYGEFDGSVGAQPNTAKSEKATAGAIIKAGELARAGGPPQPEPSGVAKLIILAGKKRRNEI